MVYPSGSIGDFTGHERRQQAFPSSSRLLDGFCLAQKKDKMAEKYRAPALPKAYRPKCPIVAPSELPKLSGKLDRSVRALIIGESLPGNLLTTFTS